MALKKGFLTPEISELNISKKQLIIAIVLWLSLSFAFYSLFYIAREAFRFTSTFDSIYIWIFTEEETFFYNLFFAFITTILSQSVIIAYLVYQAKKAFQNKRFRRSDIFNDHTFVNWNFLSWFAKAAVCYGIWMGSVGASFYYSFSLYPDYKIVFILIPIFLFHSSWNSLLRIFKRKVYKWFLLSALSITILSFGLANINLTDYQSLNELVLSKNPFHNYQLNRVRSDIYNRIEKRDLVEDIYLVNPKHKGLKNQPLIVVNGQEIEIEQLKVTIEDLQNSHYEEDLRFLTFNMLIDKSIPMDFINQVKFQMSLASVGRVAYSVIPCDFKAIDNYMYSIGLNMRNPTIGDGISPPVSFDILYSDLKNFEDAYPIYLISKSQCMINGSLMNNDDKYDRFRSIILNDFNPEFVFYINENLSFEDYFEVLYAFRKALLDIKNEYSFYMFLKHYDDLDWDQRKIVNKKYPARLYELSPEMIEYMEKESNE